MNGVVGRRLFTSALILSISVVASAQTRHVDISYSISPEEVSSGEPVTLIFAARNNLQRPITIDLGIEQTQNFQFAVLYPDGSKTQVRPPLRGGFSPIGIVTLKPGERYSEEFFLSGWLNLDAPGEYEIDAMFKGSAKDPAGDAIAVDSTAHLTLIVVARDENQLRSRCSELLNTISSAQSYPQAENAARALSVVKDPIAISYLKQATEFWHLEPITIPALGRIGDTRAAMALISIFESGSSDGRQIARSTLERLQQQTADESVRIMIQHAIGPALEGNQGQPKK